MDLPPGLRADPVQVNDERDLSDAFAVISTYETQVSGWSMASPESVRSAIAGPDALAGAHRLVRSGDEPVGLLVAEVDRHGREVFLQAYGLGEQAAAIQRSLIAFGLAEAERIAAADPVVARPDSDPYQPDELRWQAFSACSSRDTSLPMVLGGSGFRAIRRFWRMLLDLSEWSGTEPPAPPGVTLRVAESHDDRRLMHALFRESFADHFGSSHDRPTEEWLDLVASLPGADPSRWWLVFLDGEPVGLCILDHARAEAGEGYVRTLGVVPRARGRGIGRWLLDVAAADAVRLGRTGIALTVDGENSTGATALYESAGYRTRQVTDVWCRPVAG